MATYTMNCTAEELNAAVSYTGLKKIKSITLEEAVSSISFSTDAAFNALNSKLGGELRVHMPENSGVSTYTYIYARINGATSGYWCNSVQSTSYFTAGRLASVKAIAKINIDVVGGYINMLSFYRYQYRTGSGGGGYTQGGLNAGDQTAVTEIEIYNGSYTFPEGTVVEWWERG